MKTKILVSVMAAVFAWAVCGVGDVQAGSQGFGPSDGQMVALGVVAAGVVTAIVLMVVNTSGGEKAEKVADPEEDVITASIEPAPRPQLRIDPVLTLQKDGVGAGVAFSF